MKWVGDDQETALSDGGKDTLACFLRNGSPQPPIKLDMTLDGQSVNFELDTGATVTIMSDPVFLQLFRDKSLQHHSLS